MADFTVYSRRFPPKNREDTGVSLVQIELHDAMGKLILDPNRMALCAYTRQLPVAERTDMASFLSGKPALRLKTDEVSVLLTKDEIMRMYRHDLTPSEVRNLLDHFGAFHEIHDDFYDEQTLGALQPMAQRGPE